MLLYSNKTEIIQPFLINYKKFVLTFVLTIN